MNDDHRKELLSGNEAIARGAWEAGVQVATGYPGTPSTEILESLVKLPDVHCQWSTNEKVALEVAVGAAIAGARSMVTMKHVGVNVAADPLFSCAYTGVNGALVIVSADEPSMHSSQNEQDNRLYAKFAKIAMLEPSDSQECKEMIMQALDLSERFATPVMLRTTTRVSHSKSSVSCGERHPHPARNYIKDANRYVTMPANARILRVDLEERLQRLQSYSEESDLNRI
ncbi:MAG: thiamine pyrophosphate-binding protein, partial [Symbiobacteriaceae bacterium]|nr:thiamine pyrophosphate-binding protein [Symbiobacteriaceae bacterium]